MTTGSLFSAYFIEEGVELAADWAATQQRVADTRATIAGLISDFAKRKAPNEANTESDLIQPILLALGWTDFSRQETAGRSDVPDYLLFVDSGAKQRAVQREADRYRNGAAILEAKKWDRPLDQATRADTAPSTQILRYLGAISVLSGDAIRFGFLTNGRFWRLYDQKARSRLEGFVEIDLAEAVKDDHQLRLFLYLFGRDAFASEAGGRTRLERAIAASRDFEARVTSSLAETVFGRVFPDLADALARNDPKRSASVAYFAELREAALTWLYRLLFTLYAEDRDLIPTRTRRDGLRTMRSEVADALDQDEALSSHPEYDSDLRRLWRKIDGGDTGIGLPPYNGGLFREGRSELLDRSLMPDSDLAPLLDPLSRERTGDRPRLINYRDLNVQHLGSVYERLLEFDLIEEGGRIVTRPQAFARKTSGSYYTPEELVMLVIRRTIGPLLEDKRQAFAAAVADKERAKQEPHYRLSWLGHSDPANAFLTLRICDPAMGSGHFLVSLVDYLADQVMEVTRWAAEQVEGYRSPLLDRLEAIRNRIMEQAKTNSWAIDDRQLIDRQLVRRIILKRVIHGVDKNPMAVELAKLSLWLHTFTVGAPLSFLDHHLRCGDSLFGEWVMSGMDRLERGGLYKRNELVAAERAISTMESVEERTDADIVEVRESAESFEEGRLQIRPLERLFDLLQGFRWIEGSAEDALKRAKALEKASNRTHDLEESLRLSRAAWDLKRRGRALDVLLEGDLGGSAEAALDMCYGRVGDGPIEREGDDPALAPLIKAATISGISNFLHWELAFPTVWREWRSPSRRSGGFDAIIGNPPWDRLKMQEVEWFAARAPNIAMATRASDRKRMVQDLHEAGNELARQYHQAAELAGLASRMANLRPEKGGQYPLLGHGDVNLYSLFVERAAQLVKADGIVGLLTPSGIAGDLSASAFFRSVSTTGRLGSLLDYANRPEAGAAEFFPDVDSRFKFSAIVFGGSARHFESAECGFFLKSAGDADLAKATFELTPNDFSAVNPNTGTSPVFRTARDAELTTSIYARLPVLVRHRNRKRGRGLDSAAAISELGLDQGEAVSDEKAWPVKYLRMFDMTNDSGLFRTRAELEFDGWYGVPGGRLKKGEREAVPLYVGRMFSNFDHRAANVTVNEENLHNPALSDPTTPEQKMDPSFHPEPQYWVDWADVDPKRTWAVAFRDIARPTDARTIISAILPGAAYGNTAALIILDRADHAACLTGNLNALALDYVARQKLQGTHANWYILEQLPVIPNADYERLFGTMTARAIVTREVLNLTYTAHDMAPFAKDLGYSGEPFTWNEADRRQRRARLDALYFHLYGLSRDDAGYILSTFPILRRHDEANFGRFLTRDLIIGQMAALNAGDPDATIVLR